MHSRSLATVAIASMVAILAACGGGEGKNGGGTGGDSDRTVIAQQSSPTNLDPRVGNDNASGRIFDLCCRGLIKVTPEMDYAPTSPRAGRRRTTVRSSSSSIPTPSSTTAGRSPRRT